MITALRILALALCALAAGAAPAAANRTFEYRAGPYRMGEYHTQFIKEVVKAPRIDGWVVRMHADLVDGRGRRVTIRDGMLHHVYFRNRDVLRARGHCSSRQPEVFYSTGEEEEAMVLPSGYGYRLRRHDRWELSAMLMSHRLRSERVWIRYRVRLSRDPRLERVRPLWVRANGCGSSSSYGIRGGGAPGSVDDRSHRWTVPLTGRIVAAGGHLHAGALGLQMRQPACGNRLLWDNRPHYAPADAAVYTAKPMLHEAGPVDTGWWTSRTGLRVRKGDQLELHGLYDGEHARGAVMAIAHLYVAAGGGGGARGGCARLPADARSTPAPPRTRPSAPYRPIPLWKADAQGRPVQLAEPEAPAVEAADGAAIAVRTTGFAPENVVLRAGQSLRWRFADAVMHNLTFASGPRLLGGENGIQGQEVVSRFEQPGRYQLFCYLHPMTMRSQVTVLPEAA